MSELEKKIINLINIYNSRDYKSCISKANFLINQGTKAGVVYNILGAALSAINLHQDAIKAYNNAINFEPKNEEFYRNLGKSLINIKKNKEALIAFEKSVKLKSKNDDALFNIGLIHLKNNNYNESIKYFHLAIETNKNFYKAYYNLGIVYSLMGDFQLATKYYLDSIHINKEYYKAFNNLGSIYINLKQIHKAIEALNKAIGINPNYVEAITNLGVAYMEIKNFKMALNYFNKALKIKPNFSQALVQKLFILRKLSDWSEDSNLSKSLNIINQDQTLITPWQLLSLEDNPENELLRAMRYGSQFKLKNKKKLIHNNSKIRIGYFTPDFFNHAGMMNMEGLFKYYDKDKFEIIGFDYGYNNKDETHKRIKKYFDKFYYVSDLDDKKIANLSQQNCVDIAIHRNGYSQNSRTNIFSYQPALLQINFLGYPGTTGLSFIDYIVADEIVIPKKNEVFFSERIIYLPNSYYPTYAERKISNKNYNKQMFDIDNNAFVFCSFNNNYKISSKEFNIWMRLLKRTKGSYLLLLANDELTKNNLQKEAIKRKVEPNRIKFLNFTKIEDHLARHSIADLYLDTFNYNGHTSAVDALFSGVPVVTMQGNSFTARVCSSILNSFDMNNLVTNSEEEYENLAFEISQDGELLQKLKKQVMHNKIHSNLFDTKKYVMQLEKAFLLAYDNKKNKNIVENIYL